MIKNSDSEFRASESMTPSLGLWSAPSIWGNSFASLSAVASGITNGFTSNEILSPPDVTVYSRKVFLGGLLRMSSDDIIEYFTRFGSVTVDWPHRDYLCGNIPPNGYAFLVFKNARSVNRLLENCYINNGKTSISVLSQSHHERMIQVRVWCIDDQEFKMDESSVNYRFSVFVGGVPRTTTARELAMLMHQKIGHVALVSIEVDHDTKYPKGAARVVFTSREAYVVAVAMRMIRISTPEQEKDLEIKPFLIDCALCEFCQLVGTGHFCAELCCLMYLCEPCWFKHHSIRLLTHKPMVKKVCLRNRISSDVAACSSHSPFTQGHNNAVSGDVNKVFYPRLPVRCGQCCQAIEPNSTNTSCQSQSSDDGFAHPM